MCGIAGVVSPHGGAKPEWVRGMIQAQRHRGPDDEGVWADEHCVLGHSRLAIIDLSPAGHQPMGNADGTVWVTFNGEIYNFTQLRADLEARGHRFRTKTDTEVIVHGYEQWGQECVQRLRGMFAFAVWDQRRKSLFLARDRVGKKPLFYAQCGDRLFFASELHALAAEPHISREVDLDAVYSYLSWGYVPAPQTGFRAIAKLAPGHSLTVDLTSREMDIAGRRYWTLAYRPKLRISEAEAETRLRDVLREAVRLRMVGDVPIGAFLSGGIDSSVVVGLMAQLSSKPVKTFSIGFEEAAFTELEHARRIAARWGTDHYEHIVRPDALAILPMLVRHYGEPYADSSAIPTYYVSKIAREEVTVALNGDGGDESFGGYQRYRANQLAESIAGYPGSGLGTSLLTRFLPDSIDPNSRIRRARRFLNVACRPMPTRYGRWVGYFDEAEKVALCSPSFRDGLEPSVMGEWMSSLFETTSGLDPADAAMSVDVRSYLPYDLLVKVDITSMANSLEARSPFLDTEVMEFAAQLPVNLKLRGTQAKYLVTQAFADLLPRENVNRRKMGFGVPVGQWFRGPLRELLMECLISSESRTRDYFNREEVTRLVHEHLNGHDNSAQLWSLVMLELWHREMVDSAVIQPA